MARTEDVKWKPSFECYLDGSMGLCVVTTKRDGRQMTAQYRKSSEVKKWLGEWLEQIEGEITHGTVAHRGEPRES